MKQTKIKQIVKESKILNIHKSHYLLIPKTICDAIEVKPYQKLLKTQQEKIGME